MKSETVKLVVFGRGGDTVYYSRDARCQGYGSPDRPHAAAFHEDRQADISVPDGTPAIDLTVEGCDIMYAVRGPMVDVDLEDGSMDRLTEERSMVTAAMDQGFGGMLAYHYVRRTKEPNEPGPLDSISTAEHVRRWREHGARIGFYRDRTIVWEA